MLFFFLLVPSLSFFFVLRSRSSWLAFFCVVSMSQEWVELVLFCPPKGGFLSSCHSSFAQFLQFLPSHTLGGGGTHTTNTPAWWISSSPLHLHAPPLVSSKCWVRLKRSLYRCWKRSCSCWCWLLPSKGCVKVPLANPTSVILWCRCSFSKGITTATVLKSSEGYCSLDSKRWWSSCNHKIF